MIVEITCELPRCHRILWKAAAVRSADAEPLVAVCALADAPGVLGAAHALEEHFIQMMTAEENEHPEVMVIRHVAVGAPRSALLTAAAEAQMLIVGCRGRGGLKGMSLGSVAQAVLHHAPCPVGIVHPSASQPSWRYPVWAR